LGDGGNCAYQHRRYENSLHSSGSFIRLGKRDSSTFRLPIPDAGLSMTVCAAWESPAKSSAARDKRSLKIIR
jgi:hypothetical protein